MGNTRKTRMHADGRTYEGDALLETDELIFRGPRRMVFPFAEIRSVDASCGNLVIDDVVLELGDDAAKWADRIRNPKSVIEKLGVKAGQHVALVQIENDAFIADLEKAGVLVNVGKPRKNTDAIFYGASARAELARLPALRACLAPNGALWVIRPKGVKTITESDVMAAGKAAGLVDVKVVKFSDTHTAEKFVIPVKAR